MKTIWRTMGGLILGGALWLPAAHAATSTGVSPSFTVDTRNVGIAVAGRVRHSETGAGVPGVLVSLAGQNTATFADGNFSFTGVLLASGNSVTASKAGFLTAYRTVAAPAGASLVTLSDMRFIPQPATGKPVVTSVEPRLKGLFLSGVALNNDFTASVNWNGLTPGYVRFLVNGTQVTDQTGSGPEYAATMNMGIAPFQSSFSASGNQITVLAVGSGGQVSAPFNIFEGILPLPGPLKSLSAQGWPFTTYLDGHLALDIDLPKPPWAANLTLPVLGRFGFEMACNASFDYTVTDGAWELALGIGAEGNQGKRGSRPSIIGLNRFPKMKLYVGNKEISGEIQAGARGTATLQGGISFDQVFGHGEIQGKLELGRVGLPDLLGPGLSTTVAAVPGLGDLAKSVSVIIYVIPTVEGNVTFATRPELKFDSFELTGKAGLEAAYEPQLTKNIKLRVYVGGEPSVAFGYPGDLFRSIRFKAYAGAEFEAWVFKLGPVEYVFVDVSYPGVQGMALPMQSNGGSRSVASFRVASGNADTVHPIARGYLEAGPERFVAMDGSAKAAGGPAVRLASDHQADPITALDAFGSMGRTATKPAGTRALSALPQTGPGDDVGSQIRQASLPLVENVFPGSDPAMASRGQDLMLLYVTDNGGSNALQFTDINWTRFDGTNWSVPAKIQTNTQAEFAPQVAYDGNGDAIAVWERVADPNFNQTNLTAMAAQMEIVWSKWNHTSGAWSTPVPLTSNGYLDHAPLLCGPMTNGTVLVTWTANTSNLLMGTNGAGSQVLWAQWNPSSQSWSSPQTLLADLPNRLSQSLSGVGNLAVYAWTRDLDGVLTNASDQQVFYCAWQGGAWGAVQQFTTNSLGNRNARVAVGSDGHNYFVWQSGTNLVLSKDFSTNTTLVRADSQTAGFADYAMTIGPAGNLALLWQEMSQAGSDAHYRVLDPASGTWSKDALLFNDPPLERSFAPVWDDVGNLTVAFNKVDIIYTNKTVTLEGGGTVTITNVPQPGRVDLCVTKRRLIKDVALGAGDFTVSAENYLPGAAVTMTATLRNAGDVAVSNAVVAFYDGNPTNGGVLITNVAIPGWLEGAATNTVSALWVVPEPATNHVLYAVADPANAITEFDESNNKRSLSFGGTDLAVSLVSQTAETNGAMRVIAQVQNLGAPSATNSVLAIRRYGSTNAPLAAVAVPLLEPGRLAQVALDLPAGTQPPGESLYTLSADDTHATGDVDTNNNTSSFAVNLWVDSDGDGMPDNWMMQYFGHATGQAGDRSRAQDDADGDGVSNLAEFLAGTDPSNAASYLRIVSVNGIAASGVQVTWGSASNRLYSVQRTSALLVGSSGLTNIVEHVLSTPPENTFLDTTATNGAAFFYRIKVE